MKCPEPNCNRSGFKNKLAVDMHILRAHKGMGFGNGKYKKGMIKAAKLAADSHLEPLEKPQPKSLGELMRQEVIEVPPPAAIVIPSIGRQDFSKRFPCPYPECGGREFAGRYLGSHLREFHGVYRRGKRKNTANGKAGIGELLPEASPRPENPTSLALRIQALVQLGEMIERMKA